MCVGGGALEVLFSQHHLVTAIDIVEDWVNLINKCKSPIYDDLINKCFSTKKINLRATNDWKSTYLDADFVVIATPINYDSDKNFFDTCTVENM